MLINSYPLVSVVIPTYGRADLLNRAIDSVLKQTYENIEIIVVNDNNLNSEHYEATMISLQKYEKNPKVKVISDGSNVGGSLARNKGIELSQGEYISFLDDDDYYYSEKIQKQLAYLLENDIDVCICDMDVELNNKILGDLNKCKARVGSIQQFLIDGNAYTPMILLKKEKLLEVGMFSYSPRFQDHIIMLKLFKSGSKISHLTESLFVHNDNDHLRITNTNKILSSYEFRFNLEEELIVFLNKKQKEKYYLNRILVVTSLQRKSGFYKKSILNLIKNIRFFKKPVTFIYLIKSVLYIFVSYIYFLLRGKCV